METQPLGTDWDDVGIDWDVAVGIGVGTDRNEVGTVWDGGIIAVIAAI